MPERDRPTIKNDDQYEALRDKGYSKEVSAKIANTSSKKMAKEHEGKPSSFDDWSKDRLLKRARELDIEGRSDMSKSELISALRGSKYKEHD